MKKLIVSIVLGIFWIGLFAQTAKITIPDSWRDLSTANDSLLTRWVTGGELSPVPGTKEYYIADSWNPGNAELNAIRSAGGDTEEWPLYWVVNDTNLFYQEAPDILGNAVSLKSSVNTPNKTWGEWLPQSHVVYFRSATNPDQYWILAADYNGNLLGLNDMVTIRLSYSTYIPSYVTQPTVDANGDKVQRQSDGTFP